MWKASICYIELYFLKFIRMDSYFVGDRERALSVLKHCSSPLCISVDLQQDNKIIMCILMFSTQTEAIKLR